MSSSQSKRTALLLGATGLVGGHCLNLLLADRRYSKVTALTRRPLKFRHSKLHNVVVDFDHLRATARYWKADDFFCCFGTTIKKAQSREAFERVDLGYPFTCARLARDRGTRHFLLVSSSGANEHSPMFYLRTKGKLEQKIAGVGFRRVEILRPSLLLGDRSEVRPGERMGGKILQTLSPFFLGPLRKLRPIHARTVARAMIKLAQQTGPGVTILESEQVRVLGHDELEKDA